MTIGIKARTISVGFISNLLYRVRMRVIIVRIAIKLIIDRMIVIFMP